MKHEIVDNDIVFTVQTEQPGKWAMIDALNQVIDFWKDVKFYRVLRRQSFDSIIIRIDRDSSLF